MVAVRIVEPGRQSAKLPFSADKRTGSDDYPDTEITCDAPATAAASAAITDFEGTELDADGYLAFAFTDSAVYGGNYAYAEIDPAPAIEFALVAGPDSATAFSASIVDSTQWGGGVGFWIDGCVDASAATGITFQIRGNIPGGEVEFWLDVADVRGPTDGGTCPADATCERPVVMVPVTDTWTAHSIAWADFTDGSADGTAVPATGTNLMGLEWSMPGTDGAAETLELTLDDLAFY